MTIPRDKLLPSRLHSIGWWMQEGCI